MSAVDLRNREYVFNYDHFGHTILQFLLRCMMFVRETFFCCFWTRKLLTFRNPLRDWCFINFSMRLWHGKKLVSYIWYYWWAHWLSGIFGVMMQSRIFKEHRINTVKPPDPDIHGSRPLHGLLLRIVCQVYKEKVGDTNCNTFK